MQRSALGNVGVRAALGSAVLFGVGTPVAKLLLADASPWLLAGLLYCGSGLGLAAIRLARRAPRVHLRRQDRLTLAGAIGFGGVLGPVLLLAGLSGMPASGASLLLNAEAVCTSLLALVVFREHVGRRVMAGMLAIAAGAVVLCLTSGVAFGPPLPALAVLAACVCWGIDNNLTRTLATTDAGWLAGTKGLTAGPVNLGIALLLGARLPDPLHTAGALVTGFFAYGVSLVLFILALRHVGTARAGAYYSVAPFFGAVVAVLLGDALTWALLAAAVLMGVGVWLHLTERHEHEHTHAAATHTHWHTHEDGHHDHAHPEPVPAGVRHRHEHTHAAVTHTHPHHPDAQHRHAHGG